MSFGLSTFMRGISERDVRHSAINHRTIALLRVVLLPGALYKSAYVFLSHSIANDTCIFRRRLMQTQQYGPVKLPTLVPHISAFISGIVGELCVRGHVRQATI